MGCDGKARGKVGPSASVDVVYVDTDPDAAESAIEALERNSDRVRADVVDDPERVPAELDEADCVVSAYELGDTDGLDLLDTVRNVSARIPFILFTAQGSERVASRAISGGVTEYVPRQVHDDPYAALSRAIDAAVADTRRHRGTAESALAHSPLFERSAFAVIEWSDAFEIARVNPVAENLLAASETDLVGTPLTDIVAERKAPEMRETVAGMAAGEDDHGVYETVTGDGETILCEWHTSVVTEGDQVVGAFTQIQDVTNLVESHRQLETLISDLSSMVYRCQPDERGSMEIVRGECEQLCGYTAGQLEAGTCSWVENIVHPDDREYVRDAIETAVAEREAFDLTYRIQSRDGDVRWLSERGRGVYGPDGGVTALEGFVTDITERREREEAIEALHEATRSLVTAESKREIADIVVDAAASLLNLPHTGIHYYDPDAEVLSPVAWTDAAEQTIGRPPTLCSESLAWDAFQVGETLVFDDLHANGDPFNPDSPLRSELLVPIGEHGVVIVGSTTTGAFDEDDKRLVETLCANAAAALERMDRENRLRSRERDLERENDRLDRFVELVSHDLRNPLNTAQLRLELARESVDSDHLDHVADAHDRMETLISDLLTLAREGESVSGTEPVDLRTLTEACWRTVETGQATLELAIEEPVVLEAERSRLSQVLENLFRNSVEHGSTDSDSQARQNSVEHGPEAVTITVGALPDGFYVEDDGPGIPPDKRDTVFDAGFSTAEQSTGFGLSIVQEIVQAHGWSVDVTGGTAGGVRFEITDVETR
jgi:PAS domain S-box-containing protein